MIKTIKGVEAKAGQSEILIFKFAEEEPEGGNGSGIFYFKDDDGVEANLILPVWVDYPAEDNRFNGAQLAQKLVESIEDLQTKGIKDLKEGWTIKNEGTEVIFTSKVKKDYSEVDMWITPRASNNPVKWVYEKIEEQDGVEPVLGTQEINTLTIEGEANHNGVLEVTFSDGKSVVKRKIEIEKGFSSNEIARLISLSFTDLDDWDVLNADGSADVVFTAKNPVADRGITVTISNVE